MKIANLYYKIYLVDKSMKPVYFRGTSFPISPDGGFITCRHVVDVSLKEGDLNLAIYDNEYSKYVLIDIDCIKYPTDSKLDLAFIPNALKRKKEEFLPLLDSKDSGLMIGSEVMTYGYFALDGRADNVNNGYFQGHIINIIGGDPLNPYPSLILPYPIIEGMSGSPVWFQCNGMKVAGICYGSQEQKIQKSTSTVVNDGQSQATIEEYRHLEFGLAYMTYQVIEFLESVPEASKYISSKERLPYKWLAK